MDNHDGNGPGSADHKNHEEMRELVVRRLSLDLGRPKRVGAVVAEWSIRRPEPLASVTVMVQAILQEPPWVWVFDPNDPAENVHSQVIAAPADVDRVAGVVATKANRRPAGHA